MGDAHLSFLACPAVSLSLALVLISPPVGQLNSLSRIKTWATFSLIHGLGSRIANNWCWRQSLQEDLEDLESLSLVIFKSLLDRVVDNLLCMSLPQLGDQAWWPPDVLTDFIQWSCEPYYSCETSPRVVTGIIHDIYIYSFLAEEETAPQIQAVVIIYMTSI